MGEQLLDGWGPANWSMIQWHVDPASLRYRSSETAGRACNWLNSHDGPHAEWYFRPGPIEAETGRILLERRWVGCDDGAVS